MKRTILTCCMLCITIFLSSAQDVKKAKEILDKLSAKYKTYTSIKADFKYTLEIRSAKETQVQSGTIYIKKEKFQLDMEDQVVITDGKIMWTILKDAKEVNINKYEPKQMDFIPSEMFAMWEKGYLYGYSGDETDKAGRTLQVIELTPDDKKQSYFKVKLFVDKAKSTIVKTELYEKNGNIYTYEITNFTPNFAVDDKMFTFEKAKYPDYTVVNLNKGDK